MFVISLVNMSMSHWNTGEYNSELVSNKLVHVRCCQAQLCLKVLFFNVDNLAWHITQGDKKKISIEED